MGVERDEMMAIEAPFWRDTKCDFDGCSAVVDEQDQIKHNQSANIVFLKWIDRSKIDWVSEKQKKTRNKVIASTNDCIGWKSWKIAVEMWQNPLTDATSHNKNAFIDQFDCPDHNGVFGLEGEAS
jgi:hypothetical protein